jgi:signal transduction histidine kinase
VYGRDVKWIRAHGLDLAIAIAALDAALEVVLRRDDPGAPLRSPWFTAPALAVLVLCLLGRRRLPFAAPAVLWLLAAGLSFLDGRLVVFSVSVVIAGMAAAFLLGNLRDEVQARLGLVIVVGSALIIAAHDPTHTSTDYLAVPAQFAIAWTLGYALRERTVRAEAAEAAARVAVAEERARIARELHDVVAHAVSVMVLQVGAVRHRLPDELEEDADALQRVEQAGRSALTEMRALLGAMRRDDEPAELGPQPGLARLDSLLAGIRRAGLPVELHVEGTPAALPGAIDLSAYRIIQEGLTNTLKHANASRADVRLRYAGDELEIEVRDDGRAAVPADGLGHGLVGMRERVKIYGGDMTAGAAGDGGFTLRTRLPLTGYAQ